MWTQERQVEYGIICSTLNFLGVKHCLNGVIAWWYQNINWFYTVMFSIVVVCILCIFNIIITFFLLLSHIYVGWRKLHDGLSFCVDISVSKSFEPQKVVFGMKSSLCSTLQAKLCSINFVYGYILAISLDIILKIYQITFLF